MISEKEVKHIANLARIKLSNEEIKKYQKELSLILDYVKELEKIDIKNVEPTSHPLKSKNVIRQDLPRTFAGIASDDAGMHHARKVRGLPKPSEKPLREKLLEGAPERKGDFIKTLKVFE